jgi:GDSL-like Lipase/Acylhydrolase family
MGFTRRLAPRLAAMAIGLALAGLVAEAWLRYRHGAALPERLPLMQVAAHPTRGFAMLPGQRHFTYQHAVEVNSLGLRGPDLPPATDGERRVLLLGDSMVYGQGVANHETLPAALEGLLNNRQPTRVINGGVRAYATHQQLALLAELGPRIQPDCVVLCWYWNDLDERDIAATHARLIKSGPIAFDLAAPERGWPLWGWRIKQVLRRSTLIMLLWDISMRGERRPPKQAEIEAGFVRLQGYLSEFKRLCAELDAEPRFVTIPDAISSAGSLTIQLESRARAYAEAAGVPSLDLRPAVLHPHAPIIIPFDGHYNAAGNHSLALHLAAWFEPVLQIPGPQ